ncbi:MAG: nicotinamide riboside transporter PnuC [Sphingobacteriaceae bacterium]|nr:nicotinamide riboside transporter PnuC [Sphingobacteriaceae bacterium]
MIIASSFWFSLIQQFQNTSFFEWLGLVTTLICIFLAVKNNIWNWPVSIISIIISSYVFFESKLYGDFALQIYFLGTAFYGWYFWLKNKKESEKQIYSLKTKEWAISILSVALLSYLLGLFLDTYTDTDVPFSDGFCTALSFVAQIMLSRKIIQNWLLWIVVDLCYIPLYVYKNLNLYAILYAILVAMALMGYLNWRKIYHEQRN